MRLPTGPSKGVETASGAVPIAQAASAGRASLAAKQEGLNMVSKGLQAASDHEELLINRNMSKATVDFAALDEQLDRQSAETPYFNGEDIPDKYTVAGGKYEDVADGSGNMVPQSRQVPASEILPELNRDSLLAAAEAKSKTIGSDVHAQQYMDQTRQYIDSKYTKAVEKRAADLKVQMREEVTFTADTLQQQGKHGAALSLVDMTMAIPAKDKPAIKKQIRVNSEISTVDNLLQEGNMSAMTAERDMLSNTRGYQGDMDSGTRLQQRERLNRALNQRASANKAVATGTLKDYMSAITNGDAAPNDPKMKELAKVYGMSAELESAEDFGQIAWGMDNADAGSFQSRVDTANAHADQIQDHRKRKEYKNLIDAKSKERVRMLEEDPAGYSFQTNDVVQNDWLNFQRSLDENPAASRSLFDMYVNNSMADQKAKGVLADNTTLIPEESGFAEFLNTTIESGSTAERVDMVKALVGITGDHMAQVALEVAEKSPAFASAVFTYSGDPIAAETILKGQGKVNSISKAASTNAFNDYYSGIEMGNAGELTRRAVELHYIGSVEGEDLDLIDMSKYESSVLAVLGPRIEGYSNSNAATASYRRSNGMFVDSNRFSDVLDTVTDVNLADLDMGSMYIGGRPVSPSSAMENAILVPAGDGIYNIQLVGSSRIPSSPSEMGEGRASTGYVADESGQPFVLDMKSLDGLMESKEAAVKLKEREEAHKQQQEDDKETSAQRIKRHDKMMELGLL